MTPSPEPHPELGRTANLLGVWEGSGHGDYPTIEAFDYTERVEFGHVGKPFLAYRQSTRHTRDNRPLHAEMGYVRATGTTVAGNDTVELLLAQPTGISEVHVGEWTSDQTLTLTSHALFGTPSAVDVAEVRREMQLDGDVLRYRFFMAVGGHPLQLHLEAALHRVQTGEPS